MKENTGQPALLTHGRLVLANGTISAAHGEGLVDLHMRLAAATRSAVRTINGDSDEHESVDNGTDDLEQVEKLIPSNPLDQWWTAVNHPMRIAVVGRPNMGKSTLINSLVGADRLLTGPEAGITRD